MSFSDAIGQIDQIVQWEQQLADPDALTGAASTSATNSSTQTASAGATSASSFADTLAAAQADTEASAASTLDPTDSTDPTAASDLSDSSSLLGGGDSQLLSALSALSSGSSSSTASGLSGSTAATDSSSLAEAQQATVSSTSGVAGGAAASPSDPRIQSMVEEANALVGKPYVWGGGHDGWGPSTGYDCSGFVSAVLHAGGYLSTPQDTTSLPDAAGMEQGPGQYVTVYDRDQPGEAGHVIMQINGQFYESGGRHGSWGGGGGVAKISTPSAAYLATFNVVLHPAGL